MNHQTFAVIALAASAPFVTSLEPGTDAPASPTPVTTSAVAPATTPAEPAPQAATAPAPVTPTPAAAAPIPTPAVPALSIDPRTAGAALKQPASAAPATNGALSNLVADAIKRKLDRVAANKANGAIEVPGSNAAPSTGTNAFSTPGNYAPALNPAPAYDPQFGPGGGSPERTMMSEGARVMMGSPTDGSPSYVRVAASSTDAPAAAPGAAPPAAPTAPTPAPVKTAAANPLAAPTDPMEAPASAAAASAPGPQHNMLDIFVGTWDVTANFDTGPGQPPETASGQMTNAWQLEGRWLKQEYSGQMASLGSFRGLGFLGYDNLQKTFVGTWMDTLSTSCFMSKGNFDDANATFTLTGDFTVEGGEKYKQKQVMSVLSPDRYVVTMYLTGPDGVEFKTGNLEYTRAAKKVSIAPVK